MNSVSRDPAVRTLDTADTLLPAIAILGQVPYTTIVTGAGGGLSQHGDIAINRWRADATRDDYGQWCYLRNLRTGTIWSAGHQPVCAAAHWYRVTMADDRVTFHRRDGSIETTTEIIVVAGAAAESRRVTVANLSDSEAEIELTSYQEVVLAPLASDRGHRAFSNLFVQTEWLPESGTILAMRRPRSAKDDTLWCGHTIAVSGPGEFPVSCETDRASFIGRGRSSRNPLAMDNAGSLTGSVGAVLDPVLALRTRVTIPGGESAHVIFTTFAAAHRDAALNQARVYSGFEEAEKRFGSSPSEAACARDDLGVSAAEAAAYQNAAGMLLYGGPAAGRLVSGKLQSEAGRAELVAIGVSGEWPIVLATLRTSGDERRVRELFTLHRYWKAKGIACDLVIVCEGQRASERGDDVASTVRASGGTDLLDQPRGVFVRRRDALSAADMQALEASARIRINSGGASLAHMLNDNGAAPGVGAIVPSPADVTSSLSGLNDAPPATPSQSTPSGLLHGDPPGDLAFFNGLGGFNGQGEYEIRLDGNRLPPAPWINVVANPSGGFLISECGAGPTWSINSSFFRLTPWQNDPVQDPAGECIYIRDEDTGQIWTPTPAPIRETTRYTIRHGAGYSVFEHVHDGILTSLRVGMPEVDPVKIQVLSLTNSGTRIRRITITSYAEWVLGGNRERTQSHVKTRLLSDESTMLAVNTFEPEFATRVAFSSLSEPLSAATANRRSFIGRNGSLASPSGLTGTHLDGKTEEVVDACAALQATIELSPGETRDITVLLGSGNGTDGAVAMARQYRSPLAANAALDQSAAAWHKRLSTIRVTTPEPTFDLMVNQWALYQGLSCRMWGRIALYQSSGAFGFRDQLQDAMAFGYAEPLIARNHILHASSRQFEEGDVQHWWHPDSGRGVRTRFADDLIWLPFVVNHYLRVVGDASILEEMVPYVTSRQLLPDEDELYAVPDISPLSESLYDHCVRALRRACTSGAHGLPLIGGGDWNDGMNRVGIEGKGESVWLAWFLIATLREFATHSQARSDHAVTAEFLETASRYSDAIEQTSWDGAWYRRAYYDDGAPLGSSVNEECRIDAIAQSWSVISRAGAPDRARTAMQSFNKHLVRDDARLLMLLTPAFDRGAHDPGYIQGYLPGVRENGAQYTHAAMWGVLATAMLGDGDRAFELFQMTNPVTHSLTAEAVATYKVEPYVVAADVYTAEGHLGRGGWTWYTGSASWQYRVGIESILGFSKRGNTLSIDPCIPSVWPGFGIEYRHGNTAYSIIVNNPHGAQSGVASTTVDGDHIDGPIELVDDGRRREVVVTLGGN